MKRGNLQKAQLNRASLEPSLFVFPPINQNQLKKSFLIKTSKHKTTTTTIIAKQPIRSRLISSSRTPLPLKLIVAQPTIYAFNGVSPSKYSTLEQPKIPKITVDQHEIEKSIGGTSIYQFSEIDKSDLIMDNIKKVISQKGSLLSIINEIQQADVLELKSIYPQIVNTLIDELQTHIELIQWLKGFALLMGIIEESLFSHEILMNKNISRLVQGHDHKIIVEIFSNFIHRIGLQIQFIRDEKLQFLITILNEIILYIMPLDIHETNIERIVRGCNQCFRLQKIRDGFQHLTSKLNNKELGRCGRVICYTYYKFEKIEIPQFESFNFQQIYLHNVESQLKMANDFI